MANYKITSIEFDFEMEPGMYPSEGYQQQIIEVTLSQIWVADDEDDLTDEITNASGWCIKSIDYVEVNQPVS